MCGGLCNECMDPLCRGLVWSRDKWRSMSHESSDEFGVSREWLGGIAGSSVPGLDQISAL